jgi:hypothetical protein
MRFIQCEMSMTTKGRTADDLLINARAVSRCKYDLDGRMKHG